MLKYFTDFIDESTRIDEELTDYYIKFQNELGITEIEINKIIEKLVKKEKLRDNL